MASKRLKGITIEIDGSTTKLNDALKSTNKVIASSNSELRDLNKALKLDPKNTELLAQKQELLQKNISESYKKLNLLKETQKQMGSYNSLTEEQKENYRALTSEISKSESAIKKMNAELKNVNKIDLSKVGATLKRIGVIAEKVMKKIGQVAIGVSTAMAGAVVAGVKSYADLEQNIGGVETLFGDNANKVISNAKKAYETAGVSTNEYMAGVTSFSASLLQSLGGDTSKAADVADMAFKDMSDNANKFGTDMSSIQYAYQGFAKQNYTMLDNLKLGYGGTKSEMERLLSDAEKLTGVKYDINNLSDVYNAIHVIQEKLKVTGTTAKEASTTISGSATAMKSAFDNFLNGTGTPGQLSSTITVFLTNISNAISNLAPKILDGVATAIANVAPKLGSIISKLLPQLLSSAQTLIATLLQMISSNVQPISNMVVTLMINLVNFILQNLPMIIQTGLQLVLALANGIAQSLPSLLPTIINTILTIVTGLLDNIDLIVDTGIQLLIGLTDGLLSALPQLIDRLPEIIDKIIMALTTNMPKLVEAGIVITIKLAEGLIKAIPQLISKIPQIIGSLINGFGNYYSRMGEIGKNLVKGIWKGISGSFNWITAKLEKWTGDVVKFIKKIFGIHSPSTIMRDQVGLNLIRGIALGFEKGMPTTLKKVSKAMKDLNYGVQSSVNPIINPSIYNKQTVKQNENKETTSPNNKQSFKNESFNLVINNNSKYISEATNARQIRQELELYNLKYGKVGA